MARQSGAGAVIVADVLAAQGVAYVLVVGRALWAVFYRTVFREPWMEGGERQLSAELASREIITKLPYAGGAGHLAYSVMSCDSCRLIIPAANHPSMGLPVRQSALSHLHCKS